jgi:serine protease SohB
MAFWLDIAAFALKALLIVSAIGVVAFIVARLARGDDDDEESRIEVEPIHERYNRDRARLTAEIFAKKEFKAFIKARKKARKAPPPDKRIYVLSFKGDLAASAVKKLGREIDALLTIVRPEVDEVVVRIESPGGTVTGYGLAAAELDRLRARKIRLIASVDQVAASGGYLMACVADRIIAAPFAMLGSIGVVAQVPNVHRLLKRNDIDFEEMTAGEHKRSVSIFGEITEAGREHFRGKLDATHEAFKAFVKVNRPAVDVAKVGDGDAWLASEALDLGLIDELLTGDDYLFRASEGARLYGVTVSEHKSALRQLLDRFGFAARLFSHAWSGLGLGARWRL